MNKIKIEKNNGIIKSEIINTSTINKKDKKTKIITFNFLKENSLQQKENKEIQHFIKFIFTSFKENHQNDIIIEIYKQLLTIKNKQELEKLFLYFIKYYYKNNSKAISYEKNILIKNYETSKDNILNSFAKTAIKQNFKLLVSRMSQERIKNYYAISKTPQNNVLDHLKIDFSEENKKSMLYELSKYELEKELEKAYIARKKHLCFGCPVPILECPKMLDIELKHIENYDFITDGEQIYDQNGELESFKVTRCLKLEKKQGLPKK